MSAKIFGVLGALLVAVTPLAVSAQHHPQDHRSGDHRQPDRRPDSGRPGPGNAYGNWNDRWGARPPAPPRHWSRKGDWYRHVRACQQRYRSYNPRTDSFEIRRGVTRRCAL